MFCFGTIVELEYTEWLLGMMFFFCFFVFFNTCSHSGIEQIAKIMQEVMSPNSSPLARDLE